MKPATPGSAAGPTSKPKLPQPIKQDEMKAVLDQRLVIETLDRDLKKAKEELTKMELILIDRVQRNAKQEQGNLALGVEKKDGLKHTPWKELYAGIAGPEKVELQMEATRKVNALPENQRTLLIVMNLGRVEKTA